ncbi:hypothetical protein [Saccharopolyspora spinosa]|uniref:Uncharacterized protein n=1 Tax=Saccharopolyspora spinosa TaxID=60894 RepID=A0A2N3Y3A1_SACSN|nr:hypothetical protein [Saccharopolyspora spinosa]PKW17392.1 hypothetical protein A8926_5351 [Saccharopolyspora spinosa]
MGLFRSTPKLATVLGRAFRCLVCGCSEFWDREVKLNTSAAEFFDLAWANRSALGLICARCGYVHEFAGRDKPELWKLDKGYPAGAE